MSTGPPTDSAPTDPARPGQRLRELLADDRVTCGASDGGPGHARATVDVPADRWLDALTAARDDPGLGCEFFDWLSAVDEPPDGYAVVAHLWSVAARHGLLVRTRVPADAPTLPSAVAVYPGADWHERETFEMFGVRFDGHPGLVPLLLPVEFEGHPLRKEFVLAARVAKPWPGAKEPGEPAAGAAAGAPARAGETGAAGRTGAGRAGGGRARARRQPLRPPGVPPPDQWGPQAESSQSSTGEGQP